MQRVPSESPSLCAMKTPTPEMMADAHLSSAGFRGGGYVKAWARPLLGAVRPSEWANNNNSTAGEAEM